MSELRYITDDELRAGVRIIRRRFLEYKEPLLELPALYVMEETVREILQMTDPAKVPIKSQGYTVKIPLTIDEMILNLDKPFSTDEIISFTKLFTKP